MESSRRQGRSSTDSFSPRHGSTRPGSRSRSPRPHRHREQRTRRSSPDREARRSRSPERSARQSSYRDERRRSEERHKRKRSPWGGDEDRRRHRKRLDEEQSGDVKLPFGARRLVKGDFEGFRPLLGYYLRIQKQRDARGMEERELRGRWKSFLGKWNKGELAEGWYDPGIFEVAKEAEAGYGDEGEEEERVTESRREGRHRRRDEDDRRKVEDDSVERRVEEEDGDSNSDSDIGPALPPSYYRSGARHTAATPHLEDLKIRDELAAEESAQERADRISSIRHARKLDRREQKERLEELVPRADPGSRERQLEKKRETNEKMKQFRERSPGVGEADEGTLMGAGGEDSLEAAKKEKEVRERKKSEREARREEIWRARMAEREERVREYREREEGTIEMLKELARSSGRSAL